MRTKRPPLPLNDLLAGGSDIKKMFGVNAAGLGRARISRPTVFIRCAKCARHFLSRRLRGRWSGEIQIRDGFPGQTHNIEQSWYVCLRCRTNVEAS